jgi:hypothetical protein
MSPKSKSRAGDFLGVDIFERRHGDLAQIIFEGVGGMQVKPFIEAPAKLKYE